MLAPAEIGALLSLVRATACILGRDRDAVAYDVNRFAGVEDLRYLPTAELKRVVLFMHELQIRALDAERERGSSKSDLPETK